METKAYSTIDKTQWGQGPWQNEPDKVQWEDSKTKLPCLAVRNPHLGHWCGYVGVFQGHKYFAVDYQKLYSEDLEVHGQLTFSDFCDPSHEEDRKICHVPGEGESDKVWWLGFDCNHSFDYAPNDTWGWRDQTCYRTLSYVQNECQKLAAQLAKA